MREWHFRSVLHKWRMIACPTAVNFLFVFACGGGQVSATTKAVKCVREEEVTSFISESPSVVCSLYWVSNE